MSLFVTTELQIQKIAQIQKAEPFSKETPPNIVSSYYSPLCGHSNAEYPIDLNKPGYKELIEAVKAEQNRNFGIDKVDDKECWLWTKNRNRVFQPNKDRMDLLEQDSIEEDEDEMLDQIQGNEEDSADVVEVIREEEDNEKEDSSNFDAEEESN